MIAIMSAGLAALFLSLDSGPDTENDEVPNDPPEEDDVQNASSNIVTGTEGNDIMFSLYSEVEEPEIHGLDGDDTLYGEGNSTISGDDGDDTLVLRDSSFSSATVAIGGEGRDSFVVEISSSISTDEHIDTIEDFNPALDSIEIRLRPTDDYDDQHETLYSSTYSVNSIIATETDNGTIIEILGTEQLRIASPLLEETELSNFTRVIFLRDVFDFDISGIGTNS